MRLGSIERRRGTRRDGIVGILDGGRAKVHVRFSGDSFANSVPYHSSALVSDLSSSDSFCLITKEGLHDTASVGTASSGKRSAHGYVSVPSNETMLISTVSGL
jgi:hypothetical protein